MKLARPLCPAFAELRFAGMPVAPAFTALSLFLIILAVGSKTALAAEVTPHHHKQAITEQIGEYAHRWDAKQSESFAELFTADARMERRVRGELVDSSVVEGKEAILEYARQSHLGRLADRQTRHHMTSILFLEVNESTALTENTALITHQTAQSRAPFISSTGVYRISWTLTGQGWKIRERILFSDAPPQ